MARLVILVCVSKRGLEGVIFGVSILVTAIIEAACVGLAGVCSRLLCDKLLKTLLLVLILTEEFTGVSG